MANAREIRAGRAYVEIALRDKLGAGLAKAAARLKAFGVGVAGLGLKLAGLGAAAVTPLLGLTKLFANAGSEIADASARTGIAAEQLQALKFAAEQSGASLEDVEMGARKMATAIDDAAKGSKEARSSLARLGLSVTDLAGLSPDKQFELLADRLSKVKDPGQRAALAMDLFGKSGTKLLPMLQGGAAGLREAAAEAERLGLIMSAEDVAAADDFGDALDVLGAQVKRVGEELGNSVARALMPFADAAKEGLATAIRWVKEHRGMAAAALAAAAGVVALGVGVAAAGVAIAGVGYVLGGLAAGLSVLGAIAGAVLSPLGAVAAAVIGAGAAFFYLTDAGNAFKGGLKDLLIKFLNTARVILGSTGTIGDAWDMAMGEIVFAARGVWEDIKLGWAQLKGFLGGIFDSIGELFVEAQIRAAAAASKVWAKAAAFYQTLITNTGDDEVAREIKEKIAAVEQAKAEIRGREDLTPRQKRVAEAKLDRARQKLEQDLAIVEQSRNATLAQINAERDAKVAAAEKEMQAQLEDLKQISAANAAGRQQDEAEARAEAEQKKIDAEREAERKRRQAGLAASGQQSLLQRIEGYLAEVQGLFAGGGGGGDREPPSAADLGAVLEKHLKPHGQFGGMLASQAFGSASQKAIERTAVAAERTAKNTDTIARTSRRGLTFGA